MSLEAEDYFTPVSSKYQKPKELYRAAENAKGHAKDVLLGWGGWRRDEKHFFCSEKGRRIRRDSAN